MALAVARPESQAMRAGRRLRAAGRAALLAAALSAAGAGFAQTKVFRCEVGGRVVYQQSACAPQGAASAAGAAASAAAPAKAASAVSPPRRAPAATSATTSAATGASAPRVTAAAAASPASAAAPRR